MRSLIMFRHGKSDWHADSSDEDRLRPLSKRGKKAARAMGRFLAAADQVPDAALTSPALRATETLRLAMDAGAWDCPVEERPGLYGDVGALLTDIKRAPAAAETLLIVGHEPAWSTAASSLIGGGTLRLPTAAMARIDVDVDRWADLTPSTGQLLWLVPPRLLPKDRSGFAK